MGIPPTPPYVVLNPYLIIVHAMLLYSPIPTHKHGNVDWVLTSVGRTIVILLSPFFNLHYWYPQSNEILWCSSEFQSHLQPNVDFFFHGF